MVRLSDCAAKAHPDDWNDRTMQTACAHIEREWREYVAGFTHGPERPHPFKSGQVFDVRAILGEADAPAEAVWKIELQSFIDAGFMPNLELESWKISSLARKKINLRGEI